MYTCLSICDRYLCVCVFKGISEKVQMCVWAYEWARVPYYTCVLVYVLINQLIDGVSLFLFL